MYFKVDVKPKQTLEHNSWSPVSYVLTTNKQYIYYSILIFLLTLLIRQFIKKNLAKMHFKYVLNGDVKISIFWKLETYLVSIIIY